MMENIIKNDSKSARRRRQRLKKKEKSSENVENRKEEKNLEVKTEEKVNKQQENIQEVHHQENSIDMNKSANEKTKEQILAERQAKKAAKKKANPADPSKPVANPKVETKQSPTTTQQSAVVEIKSTSKQPPKTPELSQKPQPAKVEAVKATNDESKTEKTEKNREQVMAEREAKKLAKLAAKKKVEGGGAGETKEIVVKMENLSIKPEESEKKVLSKAERRAIQEAQRAAKAKALEDKKVDGPQKAQQKPKKVEAKIIIATETANKSQQNQKLPIQMKTSTTAAHKVKLFKHLYLEKFDPNIPVNPDLHPAIVQVGFQYASNSIVGSNARCYALLNAIKFLIRDYETPVGKEFSRGLEAEIQPAMEFLQKCRPFAVSMTNALKNIKMFISQENSTENDDDDDKKKRLMEKIETYAEEQIECAATSISIKVREKISNGDVILTFGCSSLIKKTLIDAWKESELKFRVIVVDSRPDYEGQQMLESLTMQGINCTYLLITSVSFIMPEVTKVILGAHGLLANGSVMSRVGTAQICLIANAYNVPVLVCCETHKFSERVQTDSFVYNEIGDPHALSVNKNTGKTFDNLKDWESNPHLTPLNLKYDVTPPELITAVVTEVAILPCTSVQVILRENLQSRYQK